MSIGPVSNQASNYIQSIISNAISGSGSSSSPASATNSGGVLTSFQDSNQLSPLAKVLSSLQQLEQSNPTQYAQVTKQIAAKLQSAAQTATANGDANLAGTLNQLSSDFTSASGSGQLPNVQDLANAIGSGAGKAGSAGHHHHHHGGGVDNDSSSSSQNGATTSTSGNSLDPLSIISSTLASATTATS